MDFELELWNEEIVHNASKNDVLSFLDALDGREKKYLVIKRKKIFILRIEINPLRQIHLYKGTLNNIKQTVQPISKKVCSKIVSEYLDEKKTWDRGIRFSKIEPYEPTTKEEIPLRKRKNEEIEDIERKTIVMTIGSILLSIILSLYIYGRLDDMSTMNPKLFYFSLIGIIAGIIFFIFMVFEIFEIRKEKKRRGI